jgi:uncharacterized membrane protein YesL
MKPSRAREQRDELAESVEGWATFILSNLLWALLSIPLITLPGATAGLFAYMLGRARGVPEELFHTFFGTMRRVWLKATLLVLLDVAVGALVVLNLSIISRMDMASDPLAFIARSVTLFVALALLLVNLYAWPLLVLIETMPIGSILRSSFTLAFVNPIWSLVVLAAAAMPILVGLLLPRGILVFGAISLCVWIICWGTWRVIRRNLPTDSELLKGERRGT